MKTARFSDVVARSGRPEIHLAFSAPESDAVLQMAAKHSRVLTLHQQIRGAKKDFGVIGIEPGRDSQYLVFPKSLRPFVGHRVIGIQYDLLAETTSASDDGKRVKPGKAGTTLGTKKAVKPEPLSKRKKARLSEPATVQKANSALVAFQQTQEETDPVKSEIRRVLTDLSLGHTAKAKQRLIALLKVEYGAQ